MLKGVIDIGSNTVVLNIYDGLDVVYHESNAIHLVGYNVNSTIQEEGIIKTTEVLKGYYQVLQEKNVTLFKGFITEPARNITNQKEMLDSFESSGIPITALTGKEEAELDYLGSRIDSSDITEGNAFDIGGGSTEFVSFIDNKIHEAVSIPVGCVRLSVLPIERSLTLSYVKETLEHYPELSKVKSDTLIGIGGTVRASAKLYKGLYPYGNDIMLKEYLEEIYSGLKNAETRYVSALKEYVDPGRQAVYLPGLNMLLAIMDTYNATKIRVSSGCVREGFLERYL